MRQILPLCQYSSDVDPGLREFDPRRFLMNKGKGENPHFQVAGAGNAVTLLHGMGASLDTWEKQVSRLSKNYKIITPNTRGFGKNPGVSIYTMHRCVEDIYNLLAALKIEKTCWLGFSMGGFLPPDFLSGFQNFCKVSFLWAASEK